MDSYNENFKNLISFSNCVITQDEHKQFEHLVPNYMSLPSVDDYKGLPKLTGLNIGVPKDKSRVLDLIRKGSCILFCNEIVKGLYTYVQVVYLTFSNKIKFKMF